MNTMDKDKMAQWNKTYKEDQIAKLDQQKGPGHRSQWIYSPYDGRRDKEIPSWRWIRDYPKMAKYEIKTIISNVKKDPITGRYTYDEKIKDDPTL